MLFDPKIIFKIQNSICQLEDFSTSFFWHQAKVPTFPYKPKKCFTITVPYAVEFFLYLVRIRKSLDSNPCSLFRFRLPVHVGLYLYR